MATKIDVDNSGNVTYQIDGDAKQTMFPNTREGGVSEEEVNEIVSDAITDDLLPYFSQNFSAVFQSLRATDVTSDITFTNGNYTNFTLIKAVKIASILFIQGSVTPTTEMGPSGSAAVVFDVKSALGIDSRAGFGLTSDKFFGAYVTAIDSGTTKVNIKKIDSTNWPTSVTVGVTLIIPLA